MHLGKVPLRLEKRGGKAEVCGEGALSKSPDTKKGKGGDVFAQKKGVCHFMRTPFWGTGLPTGQGEKRGGEKKEKLAPFESLTGGRLLLPLQGGGRGYQKQKKKGGRKERKTGLPDP